MNTLYQYLFLKIIQTIGISSTAYGRFADINGGGTIAYANNEPVICVAQNSSCLEFGTPINAHENDNHKGYGIGEHIISIPWESDNTKSAMEYPYHEGYKIVGVSSTAYGRFADINGGGAILYVNTVPVQNVFDENGNPTFGTPIKDNAIKLIKEE